MTGRPRRVRPAVGVGFGMHYRISQVWQSKPRSWIEEIPTDVVDHHLAEWSAQGWRLVNATTLYDEAPKSGTPALRMGMMHTFYWEHD
jgi:hypothetical protein